jgi:plastocyanin
MAIKQAWFALALVAMTLSGCTSGGGGGDGGDGNETGGGGVGVGGTVTGPGGGVGGNATVSGSMSSTNTSTDSPEGNMTANVTLTGGQFSPSTVTVLVGGTVTWTHDDGTNAHTVTADDGSFDSHPNCNPTLPALGDCMTDGEEFTFTFTTAGEFAYHDKVNTGMTGTVRVVEE